MSQQNDTIFISGMPSNVTEDQLINYFGSIGVIKVRDIVLVFFVL